MSNVILHGATPPRNLEQATIFSLSKEALKTLDLPWCPTVGFYQVPNELTRIAGPIIGPIAVAIFNVLASYSDPDGTSCFPSLETIARDAGCSKPTVIKYIRLMESFTMLIKTTTKWGGKEQGPQSKNRYRLLPPSMWDFSCAGKDVYRAVKLIDCDVKPLASKKTQKTKTQNKKDLVQGAPAAVPVVPAKVKTSSPSIGSRSKPAKAEIPRQTAPVAEATTESIGAALFKAGWDSLEGAIALVRRVGLERPQQQLALYERAKAFREGRGQKPMTGLGARLNRAIAENHDEIDWMPELEQERGAPNGGAYQPFVDTPAPPSEPTVTKKHTSKPAKAPKPVKFDPTVYVTALREKLKGMPSSISDKVIDSFHKSVPLLDYLDLEQWQQVKALAVAQVAREA